MGLGDLIGFGNNESTDTRHTGGKSGRYEMDSDDLVGEEPSQSNVQVFFGKVDGKEDIERIKDKLYDGHMVIADIRYIDSTPVRLEDMKAELKRIVETETGGDIVQQGEQQLIITPAGVSVSRSSF